MEISYKREMKHNYLIIVPEESFYDSYEVRMMASNCIEGLLRFHVKQADNRKSYYYEITSKQPLARLLECQSLGAGKLRRLVECIARTLERLETYLLQEGQIFLDANYIYVDTESFSVYLCLVPGRQGSFPAEMNALLQYLLGKVNHQDKECVVMAYGLYQESLKENYGMGDLLRLTARSTSEPDRTEEGKQGKESRQESGEELNWKQRDDISGSGECGNEEQTDEQRWKADEQRACGDAARRDMVGENPVNVKVVCLNLLITCAVLMGGPAFGFIVLGEAWVKKYWFLFLLADVVAAAFSATGIYRAFPRMDQRVKEYRTPIYRTEYAVKQENREAVPWQMMFQDEESEEEELKPCAFSDSEGTKEPCGQACSTVLLTEREEQAGIRRFKSMEAGVSDIVISYVPFIIGKQEGLTDCMLELEGVSRLHARIDRNGEEYLITDLNSTNGTRVGGRLLETNEMAVVKPGDEVYIANVGFVFT